MKFQNEKLLLNRLKRLVDQSPKAQNMAVLDADGTLWPQDANDILLDYEIQQGMDFKPLFSPRLQGEARRAKRCERFASLQAGLSLAEFRGLCIEALSQKRLDVFPFQEELLRHLKQRDFEIIVVTASIRQLVEVAVRLYDLPVDAVLGVETEIKRGRFSKTIIKPSPVASFKGEVFLEYSEGKKPFIAGGNTLADLPLLEMAQTAFVAHSAQKGNKNFLSETELVKKAAQNNWPVFQALC